MNQDNSLFWNWIQEYWNRTNEIKLLKLESDPTVMYLVPLLLL